MYKTIACESAGFQNGQSHFPDKTGPNGREDSWGLVQIHLPAHTNITREQALDPQFAIEWMAQQFAQHKQRMWTCARMLGYAK